MAQALIRGRGMFCRQPKYEWVTWKYFLINAGLRHKKRVGREINWLTVRETIKQMNLRHLAYRPTRTPHNSCAFWERYKPQRENYWEIRGEPVAVSHMSRRYRSPPPWAWRATTTLATTVSVEKNTINWKKPKKKQNTYLGLRGTRFRRFQTYAVFKMKKQFFLIIYNF